MTYDQVWWPILRIFALHLTRPKCTQTAVNTHTHTHTHTPWTHTRSSGQPFMLRRPGSSWGFGALLKSTSVVVLKEERAPPGVVFCCCSPSASGFWTLKAIFSIFRFFLHPQITDFKIIVSQPNIAKPYINGKLFYSAFSKKLKGPLWLVLWTRVTNMMCSTSWTLQHKVEAYLQTLNHIFKLGQ